MGDGAFPNPYPKENPHLVKLPAIMYMSVIDDEAGMFKIAREVCWDLPETNWDPDLLTDRAIICPMGKQVDKLNKYCMENIPGEIISLYIAYKLLNSDEQVRELYRVDYTATAKTKHLTPRNMNFPVYTQNVSLYFF
jgi:hypothetical protein